MLDKALEADPAFVKAYATRASYLFQGGNMPAAAESLLEAQKLDYRLPQIQRADIKAMSYRFSGQADKMIKFLRIQAQLRDDASSHSDLATMLMIASELEEAKAEFRISLARDSLNLGIYLVLSVLERATGNMDAAVANARAYQQARPEDMEAHIQLGDLLRDSGPT